MFDIAFSEVLIIFVLALVVLGPEKLPRVAAQVGRWIGRARGMARQFREQLEEEVNLEEARKKAQPLAPVAETPAPTSPQAEPEQQVVYPDHYSHAHPTDSLGRPLAAPTNEAAAAESGQHDWVGGVTGGEKTGTDKPAQPPADAAYAPSHERGT
jgi:sec-independent protein translocase protein TatB